MLSVSRFYRSPEFATALVLAFVVLVWSLGFYHIQQNIRVIYATLFDNADISVYALTVDVINEAGLSILQLLTLYVNTYGALTYILSPQ